MDRRNFLIGGISTSAAVRAWPFRVYSFPSQIITVDYSAEKEKCIRLVRTYLDLQVAKGVLAGYSVEATCQFPHNFAQFDAENEISQLKQEVERLRHAGCWRVRDVGARLLSGLGSRRPLIGT